MEERKEDTVTRLRSGPNSSDPVFEEDADEIEALRAELDKAVAALKRIAAADFLDFSLAPDRSAAAIARAALVKAPPSQA